MGGKAAVQRDKVRGITVIRHRALRLDFLNHFLQGIDGVVKTVWCERCGAKGFCTVRAM